MNPRASFIRKVIYLGLIVALLVPLSLIGMPAKKNDGSGGGKLAELRRVNDISEASLGEIDPTAESVKLAMFGLRAPAITMLYNRINEQQKRKQWDDQRATLEELSKLQPHFTGVWRHQAWNLSYNISAEWDDFKQRYRCVKDGIKFLYEGTTKNRREARMIWDMGWFTGQKIGRSDEHREFRKLFASPSDDLYEFLDVRLPVPSVKQPNMARDNWLSGKLWYQGGEVMIDQGDADLIGMGDFQYFSSAPMSQFNYAEAIETEGAFGDLARQAWSKGAEEFRNFGTRDMAVEQDVTVKLNDWDALNEQRTEIGNQLEALSPGLAAKIGEEKKAKLKPEVKQAMETPADKRTEEQNQLALMSLGELFVRPSEVAARLPADKQAEGKLLSDKFDKISSDMTEIDRLRQIVNYSYWIERGMLETRDDTLEARRLAYLADQAVEQGNLEQAKEYYAGSLANWKTALDAHPNMKEDNVVGDDLAQMIRKYQASVLDKLNEKLPEDPLYAELLERFWE